MGSFEDQGSNLRYLLLAYGNQDAVEALSEDEMRALGEACLEFDKELQATGKVVRAESLEWGSTCLRLRGGELVVTDGPFLDTKDLVGGVVVIEADSKEEAIRVASLHPAARIGEELGWGIELRPYGVCEAVELASEKGA